MQKASRYVFILLKNTFIISVIGLLLAWIGGEGSFYQLVFGLIGLYASLLTIFLFILHVIVLILAFIFKNNNPGN